ncbi:MAG: hypothetical protein IKS53_02090 [Bacteroidales bacterium]|nr:hypothetical protein [Bacteroidales bacterium]
MLSIVFNWLKYGLFFIFVVGFVLFLLQRSKPSQEQAVEQTFVVDSSRLLSFVVGYIIVNQQCCIISFGVRLFSYLCGVFYATNNKTYQYEKIIHCNPGFGPCFFLRESQRLHQLSHH